MQLILKKKSPTVLERTYDIDEGSTYTENYNETLDSANIRISQQTEQMNIEPFDKAILHDETGHFPDKYMCVDSVTETMDCISPKIYSYEISLFSETKELENTILPNLSITQRKTERKTVLDYLSLYVYDLYGPKQRTNVDFESKYTFVRYHNNDENGEFFVDKFNRVECPEMQWNAPTLREVLTDLMMVVDCIPVLRNNKIDYIDLSETKGSIDESKTNYIQRSQSGEDYVSELKMNLVNVMQTSLDGVKQTVNRIEHLTFRADSDGYVVDDTNILLKTQFPILRVNHLWMYFQAVIPVTIQGGEGRAYLKTYKVDLCNLQLMSGTIKKILYEQTEYNSLQLARYNPSDFNTIYQNDAIYYTRYNNEITGFTQLSKRNWLFDNKISTLNILKKLIVANCYDINGWSLPSGIEYAVGNYEEWFDDPNVYFSTFFDIEYETTGDAVFKASKDIAPAHSREVSDNQTFSFVDSYRQGFMEYQKANRLGNKQLHINARYETDFDNLIEIGQTYEDNIVFQTQYQFYRNHIEVNAVATKNYVLRDYFTGVKAKIRAWNYAPANESFTRHDLQKYYLEFSKSQKIEKFTPSWNMQYFMTPVIPTYIRPLKYAFVRTNDGLIEYPDNTNYYAIDLLGRIVGNSIVFTFGFDDNFTVAKRVSHELQSSDIGANYVHGMSDMHLLHISDTFVRKYGGIPLEDTKYVDNNGEFVNLNYQLTYTMDDPDALYDSDGEEYITDANDSSKFFLYRVCQLPLVEETLFSSYDKLTGTRVVYKDNKEIPKLSLQFEFCSDTHDIVFTRKFLQLQECIRELTSEEQQIQHITENETVLTSDWIQTGGTQTVTTPNPSSITGIAGEGYAGAYSFAVPSLIGKILSSYSIAGGISGHSNTVSFNSPTGAFSGTTYSTSNVPASFHATITYTVYGEETAYWVVSKQIQSTSLINQQVINLSVTGFTPTGNDEFRYSFTASTGTISIYIKTYTQPSSTLTLTVNYDLILISGSYVANTYRICQDDIDNFNWRNPQLGSAEEVSGASLSFISHTTDSQITIYGVNNHSEHVYYITDNNYNILLAVAGTNVFYLNALLSRDYNIYNAAGEVIGSI